MEDKYIYFKEKNITIAMVCDGHGGYIASLKTCNALPKLLFKALNNIKRTNIRHAQIIRKVIIDWSEQIKHYKSGSTLTGIVIKNDIVYIFNVGDSRTCLKLKPKSIIYNLDPTFDSKGNFIDNLVVNFSESQFFCTKDHDATNNIEKERIKSAGGKIVGDRLNGILSVTRSLGDADIGTGLIAVPDIFWTKKELINGPILMYSDGIYEPLRSKTKNNFNNDYLYELAVSKGAEALVNYALENNSQDNLTALLVK